MHHNSEDVPMQSAKLEVKVTPAEQHERQQEINLNSHHMTPSQILIENQDANLENLIKISERTSKHILNNKLNNFGMPKNFSFNNSNGPSSREGSRRYVSVNKIEKPFDLQVFFNDLKWHNSVKGPKHIQSKPSYLYSLKYLSRHYYFSSVKI